MTAITFPRALPDELLVAGISFLPDPMIEMSPLRSGEQITVDIGPTLWRAKFTSTGLDDDRLGAVQAFYDTILSAEAFYGYDKRREYPLAYVGGFGGLTVGGSPFDGTCVLASVEDNSVEIGLTNLPAGFVFKRGDYLAFDYGSNFRALHRVSAAATADGAGAASLEVRPPIRPGWQPESGNVVVQLHRAAAKMKIVPGSYAEQSDPGELTTTVSFEAIQTTV